MDLDQNGSLERDEFKQAGGTDAEWAFMLQIGGSASEPYYLGQQQPEDTELPPDTSIDASPLALLQVAEASAMRVHDLFYYDR